MSFHNSEYVSSELKNYKLFFDGDIELPSKNVVDFIMNSGSLPAGVYVDEFTEDVKEFNRYSLNKLKQKTSLNNISTAWTIPEEYQKMDVLSRINSIDVANDDMYIKRIKRRDHEYSLFVKYGLEDILKVVFFIVDTFRKENIVWGTGRGSSCSSYLFYLIGLHSVDVVRYEIPISDFFKGEKTLE